MSESVLIRFLYRTPVGRTVLRPFVRPAFSRMMAKYLSSPLSKWLVPYYVEKYDINLSEFQQQKFRSFNDFFKREKILNIPQNPHTVYSPCDAYLSVYRIDDTLHLPIKHSMYTLSDLLDDKKLSQHFANGICCVFRLEPKHYHHYIFPVSGNIMATKRIDGVLHTVRPIACEAYPVWFHNSREYAVIENSAFGNVIQMEIGALMVGKICNLPHVQTAVQGSEKGYFEFGGSTIMLLLENGKIQLSAKWDSVLNTHKEIPIAIGQPLGWKVND